MNSIEIITHIMELVAGVGVYMIACSMISTNLEAVSSDRLKKLLSKVSKNKLVGVAIGALATIIIQSSGATTVMTIGFVNAGIISLSQAATLIFGGEIGTTITGQIVALGLFNGGIIDITILFSAMAGIGVFINMFAKKDNTRYIGDIISGFGLLFIGLSMMSDSMNSFAMMPELKMFLSRIDNILILVIAGALITAAIHSSSAMTSIAITMVAARLISLEQGIYITLGANIGTCFTGALAAMSSSANAKRTSLIQLIFNAGGVVLLLVSDVVIKLVTNNTFSYGIMFERMFPDTPQIQLAMFHTFFNIASVLIVLPLSDQLVKLSQRLVADDKGSEETERFHFVDEHMLSTPSIAVSQVKKEIINMAKIANDNFNIAIDIITSQDYKYLENFRSNERELNFLNQNLVDFIVRLSGMSNISQKDYLYLSSTYRSISDFERIGDYSENIVEYAENLKQQKETFSKEALSEIEQIRGFINDLYKVTIEIYESGKRSGFKKAKKIEENIDELSKQMSENHIQRLNKGICSALVGAQYLKLSSDVERIGDHLININDHNYEISH
ncbi:MAG: Na/Pi cotransporter family protein [Erysipelotrichaceae bacterium]|nr:Na/Pi cotransporter family protein [Erysipelotrichaceae bacterium]